MNLCCCPYVVLTEDFVGVALVEAGDLTAGLPPAAAAAAGLAAAISGLAIASILRSVRLPAIPPAARLESGVVVPPSIPESNIFWPAS